MPFLVSEKARLCNGCDSMSYFTKPITFESLPDLPGMVRNDAFFLGDYDRVISMDNFAGVFTCCLCGSAASRGSEPNVIVRTAVPGKGGFMLGGWSGDAEGRGEVTNDVTDWYKKMGTEIVEIQGSKSYSSSRICCYL